MYVDIDVKYVFCICIKRAIVLRAKCLSPTWLLPGRSQGSQAIALRSHAMRATRVPGTVIVLPVACSAAPPVTHTYTNILTY